MNILAIYILLLFILILVGLVVVLNFYRFRFTGDKTVVFLLLFAFLFLLDIIFTLALLDYSALLPGLPV